MGSQQFTAVIAADPKGNPVIAVPFDPDRAWGAKADHPVGGTIDGKRVRGRLQPDGGRWVLPLGPRWRRDAGYALGDHVTVELSPEGPQRGDLAEDIAAALDANPAAGAFFDTLAHFYRRAYLRWIDATTRRPDVRAARIAEVTDLLAAGIKERPRTRSGDSAGGSLCHSK
ncbi:MAG: YdeI/OmpD-associated family protein [Trebonia sp.]